MKFSLNPINFLLCFVVGEPVKTGLGGRLGGVVVWAEAELKMTHVVRRQLDSHLHMLFILPSPVFYLDEF